MPSSTAQRYSELVAKGRFVAEIARKTEIATNPALLPTYADAKDAIFCDVAPTVASTRLYQGEDTTRGTLGLLIAAHGALVNVPRPIQAHQIREIENYILTNYYFLNLSEVKYVLLQGVRGKFGNYFERLDFAVITGWFDAYAEERVGIAQYENAQRKEKAPPVSPNAVPAPAAVSEMLEQLERRFNVNSSEFVADEAFLRMVESDYEYTDKTKTLEQYTQYRVAIERARAKK